MIEINLVPDVKQELIKAQRIRSTVISFAVLIGIVSIGVVVALSVYVYGVQTVRSGLIDSDITSKSKKFIGVSDLSKTLTIQNQLTKISDLNNNKKIDSRIFDLLNSIIPPKPNDIKIANIQIDSDIKLITIEGQADNSYAAVEVFKKTILGVKVKYVDNNKKKQEVLIASNISTKDSSYGLDSSGKKVLSFKISFNYIDTLFSPVEKNLVIINTSKGNKTDSYLGIPFTKPATDIKGVN